jgi:hypothetical protein
MNNRKHHLTMMNTLKNNHRHTMILIIQLVIIPVVTILTIQDCIRLKIQTSTDRIDQRADLIVSERNVHQGIIQDQEIRTEEIPEEALEVLHHALEEPARQPAEVWAFIHAEDIL